MSDMCYSAALKKKPSSCLKEVEKIKQKREERRAAIQVLREQQDLQYDTTAPNWEFGAMIRCVCLWLLYQTGSLELYLGLSILGHLYN